MLVNSLLEGVVLAVDREGTTGHWRMRVCNKGRNFKLAFTVANKGLCKRQSTNPKTAILFDS